MLVDAMIGVLVVAIGLAALAALYTYGIGVMVSADRQEKAVQIAAEKIELLKAADGHSEADIKLIAEHINSKENNKILLDNIECSIRAAVGANLYDTNRNYPGDDTIYPVKVTITWSDPQPQVLTLQTYIHTNE